jgi:hypothetical protein
VGRGGASYELGGAQDPEVIKEVIVELAGA